MKMIPGYSRYFIDDKGNVYSTQNGQIIKLKHCIQPDGYHSVYLYYATGKRTKFYVHRLVAMLFIEWHDVGDGYTVNHKDGNKDNNDYRNLEWVTVSDNIRHAMDNNLNNSRRRVIQYDMNNNILEVYSSISDAAKAVKGYRCDITDVCRHRKPSAYGFKWEYEDKSLIEIPYRMPVDKLDIDGKYICTYSSIAEALRAVDGDYSAIWRCCVGEQTTAYGFRWQYSNSNNKEIKTMDIKKYGDVNIPIIDIGPLAKQYMCLYGVNVNLQRAIPMIQDGLKPVQRRMIYQLYTMYGKKHVRVSVLMGDVMKLHPHSDQGLGDTIARMCQPFTNNIPLVESEGNSGTLAGGDDAAAARYLDITLSDFSAKALFDEFDGKVSMKPSYDDSAVEPICLPARFPIILLNGTAGIGYTLSSDIPPYNINEVADATIKLLKNPDAKIKLVPDLPTGCDIIVVADDRFVMQSSFEIDMVNYVITITNTPYMQFIEKLDTQLRILQDGPNRINEILTFDQEQERLEDGLRYVIRCKQCNLYKVLETLFKRIPGFRVGFTTTNMVVVDNDFRTKEFNPRQILRSWIDFRLAYKRGWFLRELVEKSARYDMLLGKLFMLSPENLDRTIRVFKRSTDEDAIISNLVKEYKGKVTSSQANFVKNLRLSQLNMSEYKSTEKKISDLKDEIDYIHENVADPEKIRDVVINEIKEIKEKYGFPRRSKILNSQTNDGSNISIVQILTDGSIMFSETEDPEHMSSDIVPISGNEVCLIDDKGRFIKVNLDKVPHGKPLTLTSIGKTMMGDCVAAVSNQINNIVMLTNKGRIKYMPIDKIPSNATRKPLIPTSSDEKIVAILEVPDTSHADILIYTSDGMGKRISTSDLNKVNSVDAAGQFIIKTDCEVRGMFCINSNKPYLVYVTRLGRLRLNHSKYLSTVKKFADPKPIIKLSQQDDLIAVFCVNNDQSVTLYHADSRISTVHINTLQPTTMAVEPTRPKHVPGCKCIRATLS